MSLQFYAVNSSERMLTAFSTPGWRNSFVYDNPSFEAVNAKEAYKYPQSVLFRRDYACWGDIYDDSLNLVGMARPITPDELLGSGYHNGPDFLITDDVDGIGTPAFLIGLKNATKILVDGQMKERALGKYKEACELVSKTEGLYG